MRKGRNNNGLASAGLEGYQIIGCDDDRCDTCPNESHNCKKLIAAGGNMCIE